MMKKPWDEVELTYAIVIDVLFCQAVQSYHLTISKLLFKP